MGGIGKATMAQMVYNDSLVQESYALMGWVHVFQTFDLVRLTIAITESLTRKSCSFSELSCIHDVLKKGVNGKSVFLVLDDLWNEWQDLLCPLKSPRSLTVLVTTRSKEVARLVQTAGPFILGSLPDDHCWLLFQRCAFGDSMIDEQCSLVQVGRKIMQKCGGLPLAVKAIGCMLRSKMDMQIWMEILESDFWECSDDNEEIFSALRLSFYRLPSRLKPCFLLCNFFSKRLSIYQG
jgi:cinnamyl-alcohol dehydrogenase